MHRDDMPELYFWGGAKLRARIYNALLQGQLRDSAMTYSGSELNPLIFEAWAGVTAQLDSYRLSYVLRYQSKEIKKGAGARNPMWGGLVLSASLY